MGGRWTAHGIKLSCFTIFVLALEIQGGQCLTSEGLALLQFREKVELDPFGALANWDASDSKPCMWSGVFCLDDKVYKLDLKGLSLKGTLAPELGNLSHLRFLVLSQNHFYGAIPPQLGQLTSLEVLDLSHNNLTGSIPAELGSLHSLKRLLLCNNRFVGGIPVAMRKLSVLTDLQFDEILRAAASEISRINRKVGRWLNFGSEALHSHADNSCANLIDLNSNMDNQVHNMRRVLVESSSNLAAVPPKTGQSSPSESSNALPSRSSGSFSAVPNEKRPPPAPTTPSPPTQDNKPLGVANPGAVSQPAENKKQGHLLKIIVGILSPLLLFVVGVIMFFMIRRRAPKAIRPWKTGLSGQLQKALIEGVPKLNRSELETACEDFSNIISDNDGVATMYKGTLSSGVEIFVASTAICSLKDWSKRSETAFREKIDSLSRVNHKNFVNLIGYCEENEPFTRMMVFEYAPNGTLAEHLHVKEVEHLDWHARMRIIMGISYCLEHMHNLDPPVANFNLTSEEILLTDDYAAKIGDLSFWAELIVKSRPTSQNDSQYSDLPPVDDEEADIHSLGILFLEIISGKHPCSEEHGHLINWAAQYLNDRRTISHLIDPSLKSFKDNELDVVCEVIQDCIQQDPRKRPTMKEVIEKLRQAIDISPEAATPRLSPLWWAELEILSAEAP